MEIKQQMSVIQIDIFQIDCHVKRLINGPLTGSRIPAHNEKEINITDRVMSLLNLHTKTQSRHDQYSQFIFKTI